jgi:spermidine/putrescine transport system substrate-binding protein
MVTKKKTAVPQVRMSKAMALKAGIGSKLWVYVTLAWLLSACASAESSSMDTATAADPPTVNVLNVYNWDTYIEPDILTDFEQRSGVALNYQVYDNDQDLLEELQAGGTAYDVVVPSDFVVSIMRDEDLLAPLDKDNIPNLKNLDAKFVSPVFDPANRYCAPYQWGTVGIGYDIEATGREITGWEDFFDPTFAGRVAMLDDYRTSLGVALLYLGHSPNTTDSRQIAEAVNFLRGYTAQVGAYLGDDAQDRLVNGDYDMVVEWSGDIFQVMEDNENIRYVIPKEGSIIWTDNMCVPASAPHKALAETFINFMLEPEIGARLSNYTQYGTPNAAALPYVNEADLSDPAIYPPAETQERLFFLVDVDIAATEIYQQAWGQLMAEYDS